MLYLFGPKETDFVNGDSDLIHNTYDEVIERAKGFYLKFKMTLDKDENYKKIKKEMIISAYTPDGWNQFRVFDIYNYSNHVEVVATQLHYDLNYKKVFPFNVKNTTAQTALNVFVSKFKSDLPNFKITSTITDTRDFSTDDDLERLDEGHNALEVLNRMAARWGGELDVNGYNVRLVPKLGKFTNALLYEHKNISEFVDETSMSEVITRIHAVTRFRPERVEGSEDEPEEVTIQVVVDSPLINEYAQVYEEDYTNNDARTRAELVAWARLKYSTNSVDKPARSINVETNIIDGQEINYGDDLVLKYTKHDVDEIIRCVGYQYNPNSKQYISVTLGSNTKTLSSTITGQVHDSTKNQLSNVEKQVQLVRYAANDKNRATTGPLPIPNPIEGDMWFYHPEGRPNEVELRIYRNGGWETIVNDMTGENIRKTIEAVELEAEGLAEEIAASDQKAAAALEEAGISNNLAQTAKNLATTAKNNADTAKTNATNALTNASNALDEASEARNQSEQAVIDAQSAMSDARSAKTDASTAISNAATAHADARTAMSDAQSALSKANGVESAVSTLSKEVDTVAGKVTLKAEQSEVDMVKGTVSTHTTTLSQHATAISSKAAQTEVDTISGTVDTHTTEISQNAKAISARLTQSQVDNLVNDKGYSTVSYVDTEISTTAGAIRTEMTAVEGKIPTYVGGRNLLVARDSKVGYVEVGSTNPVFLAKLRHNEYIPVESNTDYSLSGDTYERWRINWFTADKEYISGIAWDTRYAAKTKTITSPANAQLATVSYPNGRVKFEKGSIATDWTPAPEDMLQENDFNAFTASYEQSAKGWNAKLLQIEQAGYATQTWSNQTFATPQSVTTQLSSYAKSTDLNGLATESYVGTQISTTAGAIRTEMTAIEGKIPTEIGGRNLLTGTSESEQVVSGPTWPFGSWEPSLTIGEEYTFSFDIRSENATYLSSVFLNPSNSGYVPNQPVTKEWTRVSFTFTWNGGTYNGREFVPHIYPKPDYLGTYVSRIKLEKGNIATDWTPAPEDMMREGDFSAFKASYDQSAKGWNAKLLQIEQAGYATKTWSNQTFATPSSITTALSSYAKSTDLNGLATESYVGTQISATAGAIRTEMSAVESKIPTQMGGRNLLQKANVKRYGYIDFPSGAWRGLGGLAMDDSLIPVKPGDLLTASGDTKEAWRFYYKDSKGAIIAFAMRDTRPDRESFTYEVPDNPNIAYVSVSYPNGEFMKLERGGTPTDWTPAPEDMMRLNDFNTFKSTYEQTEKGIRAEITEVEGKIPTSVQEENLIIKGDGYHLTNNYLIASYDLTKELTMGETYTVVLKGRIGRDGVTQKFGLFMDNGGNFQGNLQFIHGVEGIYRLTFELKQVGSDSGSKKEIRLYNIPNNMAQARIEWIKLIEGDVTDNNFTPSRVDLITQHDYTAFTTDFDIKAQGWDATSTYVTNNKTKMNSLISNVDGWTSTISYVDNNKTKINNTISTVDSYVQTLGTDGEKIARLVMTDSVYQTSIRKGGRNLLKNAYRYIGNPNRHHSSFDIKDPIPHGTQVTLSFKAGAGNNQIVEIFNTNAYYLYGNVVFTKGTTKHVYHLTFTTHALPSGGSPIDINNQQIRLYNKLEPNPTAYILLDWAVLQYGEIGTEHYISDDEDFETQVTQLENSWALSLTSGDDIKTQINATTSGIRLQGKTIQLDGNTLMNNAFAKNVVVNQLAAADVTAFTGKFHQVIASNLDVNNLTGTKSTFLESAWTGLNSRAYIDSRRIRIESGTQGAYVELNNIPEFRSQYHDGTGVVMAKGRVQFFEPNGGSQGYMGRDIHTGTNDFGIFISRGKGWRLARATDSSSSTGDKYYTVKSGMTDRVGIIEDMVRRGILPDGNTQNFINNSNKIARLNGWEILPQNWPTQRVGDQILYEKGKVINDGGTGVSYEDVMNFGKNGALTDWWLYMRQHVRYEDGYSSASDRRIKHDIQPTNINAVDTINALSFKEFKMNKDDKYVPLGLIAQESGLLRIEDPVNEALNMELATMLSLKGVQELYQRIKELEEEVKTLKENDA